ncbi:DUF2807 domain-containing protein [Bacteroidia bacterium]|nr:DUF2807 domain-containing protein [Bacteroidia bacterium]GHU54234.1 DUF2807 domain-containing protein [Bacteroidia bacterium]
MKVKEFLGFLCCLGLLGLSSCFPFQVIKGDGDLVTQEISISDYSKIKVSNGSVNLTYSQSEETPGLTVTVDRNIFDKYDFEVIGSELQIVPKEEYKNTGFNPTVFTVTTNSTGLNKLDVAGSIDFTVNNPLLTDELELDLAGSTKVNFNDSLILNKFDVDIVGSGNLNAPAVAGNSFNGNISGSGKLILGGQITKASFEIAGSGTVRAFDLWVDDIKCEIAGSGDIEISVNNSITAEVAGSGRIKYHGDPQSITKEVAGSGSIKKVD